MLPCAVAICRKRRSLLAKQERCSDLKQRAVFNLWSIAILLQCLLNKPTFGLFTRPMPRSFIKTALLSRFYEIQT